ncbi:MAG: HAMP domain-containing histidine kinase [Clostridia bacterium]|nr:HAMP domain-containing histidine kinase [Clostridia bacterium]
MFVVCLVLCLNALISTSITYFVSRKMFKDLKTLAFSMDKVATGNFSEKVALSSSPEMKKLSQSFNKMVQELSAIEILKADFISNFSHEFKTPIASIRGFVKLLKERDISDEEKDKYVDIILCEIDRLGDLANSTLSLSKLKAQSGPEQIDIVNGEEVLGEALILMEKQICEKEINVFLDFDPVILKTDGNMLKQLCLNLLSNAVKFTNEKGDIYLSVKQKDEVAVFTFKDTGIGMSEEVKEHIFDNYYQGDSSHSTKGYGLGLAIAKKIIDLLGGDIQVISEEGKGSTFTISIPLQLEVA